MSDRTYLALSVYECPTSQAQAILDIIETFDLSIGYDDETSDDEGLALGALYSVGSVPCGSASEIAHHLMQVAPDTSWEVREDPAYEWLGSIHRFTPTLGMFAAQCDAEGEPVFTAREVQLLIEREGRPGDHPLALATGETHREALLELSKTYADVVVKST